MGRQRHRRGARRRRDRGADATGEAQGKQRAVETAGAGHHQTPSQKIGRATGMPPKKGGCAARGAWHIASHAMLRFRGAPSREVLWALSNANSPNSASPSPRRRPVANYVPAVRSGAMLVVSGQLAFGPDGKLDPAHLGKLGAAIDKEAGQEAARRCFVNVLAQSQGGHGRSRPGEALRAARRVHQRRTRLHRPSRDHERRLGPRGGGVRRRGAPCPLNDRRRVSAGGLLRGSGSAVRGRMSGDTACWSHAPSRIAACTIGRSGGSRTRPAPPRQRSGTGSRSNATCN